MATLTYVYSDSTAVVGPLSVHNEPHAYDLCQPHAQRLTAPRGWEILRVEVPVAPEAVAAAGHASVAPLRADATAVPATGSTATAPRAVDDAPKAPKSSHTRRTGVPETAASSEEFLGEDPDPASGPVATVHRLVAPDRPGPEAASPKNSVVPDSADRDRTDSVSGTSTDSAERAETLDESKSRAVDDVRDRSVSADDALEHREGTDDEHDDEYSLVNEIFAGDDLDSSSATADQPRAMRIPHLRRRARRR